ncbi:MAG: hypothetical protein ACFFAU_20080 [Candidatus Hodarchaeota archaeon]
MRNLIYFRPKKSWMLRILPLVAWIAIYIMKISLGVADPTAPPPPPPGLGG